MTHTESHLIGVDEAGLGPVLGPLVVAGVRINAKHLNRLQELGVKDSKLFGGYKTSRMKRKLVWRKAKFFIENFQLQIISANEIDSAFLNEVTMYDLEACAVTEILSKLEWQTAEVVYLHQLGQTSKSKFFQKLQKNVACFFSKDFISKTVYEKDADSKYIPVAMASIVAKVTRDALVENICQKTGKGYVSGYPNFNTAIFLRRYLKQYHTLPPDTRRTRDWSPLRELIFEEEIISRVLSSK